MRLTRRNPGRLAARLGGWIGLRTGNNLEIGPNQRLEIPARANEHFLDRLPVASLDPTKSMHFRRFLCVD